MRNRDGQEQRGKCSKLFSDFKKAARRQMFGMALGLTMLTGCANTPLRSAPAPTPATEDAPEKITAVVPAFPQAAADDAAAQMPVTPEQDSLRYAAEVRRILLNDARSRFGELAGRARTDYSVQLDSLERHMREYLQKDTSRHNNVIILDPVQTDVALALGLPVELAVLTDVLRETPAAQIRSDAPPVPFGIIVSAAENMTDFHISKAGIISHTQTPSAFPNQHAAESRPCLIVPVSDHALPFSIAGLTFDQKTEFANTHEGWHCLDSKYRLTDAQMAVLDTVSIYDFAAVKENPEAIAAGSSLHAMEMLADIASIGDMVRRGHNPAIIDSVIRWRTDNMPSDFLHNSVPGLEALKAHIAETGLDAFRRVTHDEARALYFRLTDDSTMTPTRFATALAYLTGEDADRTRLEAESALNAETRRAVAYAKAMQPDPEETLASRFRRHVTPPDTALQEKLKAWNFIAALENEAIAVGGAITPASLIEAYGNVQDSLRRAITPETEVEQREKMTLMKTFFTSYVSRADYAAANARHGIDIEVAAKDILARGRARPPALIIELRPRQEEAAPAGHLESTAPQHPRKSTACGCGVARKAG